MENLILFFSLISLNNDFIEGNNLWGFSFLLLLLLLLWYSLGSFDASYYLFLFYHRFDLIDSFSLF